MFLSSPRDGLSALAAVPEVLKATSREDVKYVAEMRQVIYSRSDKAFKREFAFHTEGANVFEHYEHHPEWILLGEDGYLPSDFVDGNPRIKPVKTVLLGGIVQCSRMKTGRMTLACLSEDGDSFRMHIVSGEGRQPPQWVEMGVPLPSWPSVKFYPDVPVRRILDHVQSQHFAAVPGDWVEELKDLCYLLGIKPILDVRQ